MNKRKSFLKPISVLMVLALVFSLFVMQASAGIVSNVVPYVQGTTHSSVYVMVECNAIGDIEVQYRQEGESSYRPSLFSSTRIQASNGTPKTYVYRLEISGLDPDTLYHYRARQAGGAYSSETWFRTAAEPGTNYTFAYFTDTQGWDGASGYNTTLSRVMAANPAPRFAVHGGDWSDDGSNYVTVKRDAFLYTFPYPSNALQFMKNRPIYVAEGNHDGLGSITKAFYQAPNLPNNRQSYYSFDQGDVHFTILDYATMGTNFTDQYNFAKQDLENTTKKWKIVVFHAPGYCNGVKTPYSRLQRLHREIFYPNGVDIVLNGHTHYFQHNVVDGIDHIIMGPANAGPRSTGGNINGLFNNGETVTGNYYTLKNINNTNMYSLFDVTPTSLNMRVYNLSGSQIYSHSWTKTSVSLPYSENFNSAVSAPPANWDIIDGSWDIVVESGSDKAYKTSSSAPLNRSVVGENSWTNYAIQTTAKVNSWSSSGGTNCIGILGRYKDTSNYYLFNYNHSQGQFKILKQVNGQWTSLANISGTLSTGTNHTLKAVFNGNSLQFYVNGALKLSATDSGLTSGKTGLMAENAECLFDDYSVQ